MNEQIDWGAIDASFQQHRGSAPPEHIEHIQPSPGSYQASIHRVEAVARNGKPTISWRFRIIGGVYIDGLARKAEPVAAQPTGAVQLPSGVAFNDEDIPF